jgi:hypothetical protein
MLGDGREYLLGHCLSSNRAHDWGRLKERVGVRVRVKMRGKLGKRIEE